MAGILTRGLLLSLLSSLVVLSTASAQFPQLTRVEGDDANITLDGSAPKLDSHYGY